ncbi:DUF3788 domain-containing protein [bacterium]|nr:DUF3788 domain-containing protein [bacterium]MBU1071915.1 DUF3788 domain-containing protein [bacterium]MBU1675692.1 DUF3788 domain-containing protein [bacterium]
MSASAFLDASRQPRPNELPAVLGRSHVHWERLLAHLAEQYAPLTATWKCYVRRCGWSLQVKRGKRTVLYMVPQQKHFRVTFVLGDKAVAVARESGLPARIITDIDAARKYVEGRGVGLEVRFEKDLDVVTRLAAIKMAN